MYFVTYLILIVGCIRSWEVDAKVFSGATVSLWQRRGRGGKKSKKKRGRDCTFNRLSQTVLGGSAVCAGTCLHPEHVLPKFEIKIKCLDPDFYAEQTGDFCLLPNLTNSINHCDEITVAGCTNASEAALPSKHRDIIQRSFSSPNITKLFFFYDLLWGCKNDKNARGQCCCCSLQWF